MANYHNNSDYERRDSEEREPNKTNVEVNMDNLAGLLALMQSNKNLDLPGLLALCKEKGLNQGWGGEGMFMFVFLILFLFAGGGWGNIGPRNQQAAASIAGDALNDIVGIHDRISSAQAASNQGFSALTNGMNQSFSDLKAATNQGFFGLDTKICQSIAETIASVRNQGDRVYDATRTVGDAIRDCCCSLNNKLDSVKCGVDGLYGHTSLVGERVTNTINQTACATDQKIAELKAAMELGFERNACLITNTAKEQELQRLQREVETLKSTQNNAIIASQVAQQMQQWTLGNYKPNGGIYGTGTSGATA